MAETELKTLQKSQRGTGAQVVLFVAVWAAAASSFQLVMALPAILVAAAAGSSPTMLTAPLPASSATMLGTSAAMALSTVLAVWIMRRYFAGPPLLDLGLRCRRGWLLDAAVGLVLGPVMFGTILLVLLAAGWVTVEAGAAPARLLLTAFATYLLVAFSEEVFARGWVLQVLVRERGRLVGVVGSSAIFALLHASNPDFGIMALLGLFLAGLVFAQAYLVTRQLWLPMALHLSWNVSQGSLFGFPVSGLPGDGLLVVTVRGPDIATGGAFGPEAGLILVVGVAPVAAAIWILGRWRSAQPGPSAGRILPKHPLASSSERRWPPAG